MIIGYNIFGADLDGLVFDTPVPTEGMNDLILNEGVYDNIFIDLNTDINEQNVKYVGWTVKTILNADFKGDLDAGSLDGGGFKVTHIQVMRSVLGSGEWEVVSVYDYNEEYNMYSFEDRYVQNGVEYEYAIAPISNQVVGDKMITDSVLINYDGHMLTDNQNNFVMDYDLDFGEMTYSNTYAVMTPINSRYPITTHGKSNYRSGSVTFLPLTPATINSGDIDNMQEQLYRQKLINFLNNDKAKALRMENGDIILVNTGNVKITFRDGGMRGLADVSFDYTEMGEMSFANKVANGLTSSSHLSNATFDEWGNVIVS